MGVRIRGLDIKAGAAKPAMVETSRRADQQAAAGLEHAQASG
jgi:hypothetical protein